MRRENAQIYNQFGFYSCVRLEFWAIYRRYEKYKRWSYTIAPPPSVLNCFQNPRSISKSGGSVQNRYNQLQVWRIPYKTFWWVTLSLVWAPWLNMGVGPLDWGGVWFPYVGRWASMLATLSPTLPLHRLWIPQPDTRHQMAENRHQITETEHHIDRKSGSNGRILLNECLNLFKHVCRNGFILVNCPDMFAETDLFY